MEDREIVDLYWQRSDNAIEESDKKYGNYCHKIAYNVCSNHEDSEECVSDTWFKAWNIMPPKRPSALNSFFGSICRNFALDVWRRKTAMKRGGGETALVYEELSGCIGDNAQPENVVEAKELEEAVRNFIHALPERERRIFLARYYFILPVAEIAKRQHEGLSKTKMTLYRTREKLIKELRKEGLC